MGLSFFGWNTEIGFVCITASQTVSRNCPSDAHSVVVQK